LAQLPRAITDLVNVFERLPGIGPKSATRLAFYLLNTPLSYVEEISSSLLRLKKEIKICGQCFGVSEDAICDICSNSKRNNRQICVVERAIDVLALENVGGFNGVYHVLGGVLNPLNHVGPEDLKIEELVSRIKYQAVPAGRQVLSIKQDEKIEIILATNPTMEGEATALYIRKKIREINGEVKISRIGSGLPMGADMEFADQATLSRAMEGRTTI
jgi:recombination protein RecR